MAIVRWVPRLVRFLPVLTFDVADLGASGLACLVTEPAVLDQVAQALLHVRTVVVPCSTALLKRRDHIEAVLQKFAELRLVHLEHHVVECALFEVPFDYRPQAFDAVELGAVRWHEEQLYVQVDRALTIEKCSVRRRIVDHNIKPRTANQEASAQKVQKASKRFSVGRFLLGEHRTRQASADCSKDSNAFAAVLA